jgi:hypothetical protein
MMLKILGLNRNEEPKVIGVQVWTVGWLKVEMQIPIQAITVWAS